MREAPAELWMRPTPTGGYWYRPMLTPPDPDAVRYVRADLYEALRARLATLAAPGHHRLLILVIVLLFGGGRIW